MPYNYYYKIIMGILFMQYTLPNYNSESIETLLYTLIFKMLGINESDINIQDTDTIVEIPKDFLDIPSIDLYGIYNNASEAVFNTSKIYFKDRITNASICIFLNALVSNVTVTINLKNCSDNCSTTLLIHPNDKWNCILLTDYMMYILLKEETSTFHIYTSTNGTLNVTYNPFIEYYVKEQHEFIDEDNDIDYYVYPVKTQEEFGIPLSIMLGEYMGISDKDYYSEDTKEDHKINNKIVKRGIKEKLSSIGKVSSLGIHIMKQLFSKKRDKEKKITVKPRPAVTNKSTTTIILEIPITYTTSTAVTCTTTAYTIVAPTNHSYTTATPIPTPTTATTTPIPTLTTTHIMPIPYSSKDCKLKRKYIKFRDMGFKWVLHPPGLDYGYCEGDCPTGIYSDNYLLHSLLALNYIDGVSFKRCCSIQKMTDITVHYRVGRNPRTSTLYNVSASQCKCV